ncbi:hypothetical protein GOL82_16370 [Sinorhizobium medicae]|nr:hypothetical protein [Sinorhizobium medicae]
MVNRLGALKNGNSLNFWGNRQPICPHCGEEYDIREHEAWELYSEDGPHIVECSSCDMEFSVSSLASWKFSTDEQEED